MGSFGAPELLFIAVFALLVFGPKRLPEIARGVGRAMREFRRATSELTEELRAGFEEPPPPSPGAPREPRPGPR